MEPVMEKSLRQCIQDLEALKTAYNCIDVEDPCTRCLGAGHELWKTCQEGVLAEWQDQE